MRLDLSKWGKSQSSPSSSIPQKIKDFHQKNHALSVFMDSAGFLCILCVFVESNPPNRTNTAFFPPHFPVFVVFQKRFLYILFFSIPPFGRPMPTRNPAAAWLPLRGSWRAAPERGAREPLRHLLALLANAASPERGGKGPMPSPALGRRAKPGLAMPAPVWEIRFTGRHPQRDPSNTRRRSSGRRYGRWRPPECPDRTTRWDRRCPSTSSCPRADRTQTADRGRAHG